MPLVKGTQIGPYEIIGWLGAGGMGEVYRARDPRLARDVAIKLIPDSFATDSSRLRRFEQEARAAGQLNHPNILAVYDVGVHAGAPYIVSELLEGVTLRRILQDGPLPPHKAVSYAGQIAEGLAAAHDKHILHRDVKPENLFITHDGRIKILDFGIAKLTRPGDEPSGTDVATQTAAGVVVGTAAYMSPEQVRGEQLDARSDLFSLGAILYEMLAGHAVFLRETMAETMTAVLKENPTLPGDVPPGLARLVSRCLEKGANARFQSARDFGFGLEMLSDPNAAIPSLVSASRNPTPLALALVALVVLTAGATLTVWFGRAPVPAVTRSLDNARYTPLTDWDGTEALAEISPDGRFVAFLSDREGQFDIWLSQVGTGEFRNLTMHLPSMSPPGVVLRNFGFSGDGSEIWFSESGQPGQRKMIMPLIGGAARPFLGEGDVTPSWSADGTRIVYFNNKEGGGDPIFIADRTGADPRQLVALEPGVLHNHNPVWSPDGEWIYFARGVEPTSQMDIWRVRVSGGPPERMTTQNAPINYFAPLDGRTLLYVARAKDRSGPWLWELDMDTKVTRRVSSGLDEYTYISVNRDGTRLVATLARPSSSLWTVPILDRQADDHDVQRHPITAVRAMAPRLGGTSLFYLSARGPDVRLWRYDQGQTAEVWKGSDRLLTEPPAVSPDGTKVAVSVRQGGTRHLTVMSADGTNLRTIGASIEIDGAPGASAIDWSPDGAWIVAGGRDQKGLALFKVPVDGQAPVRLVDGYAVNPIWSPDGTLILYAGAFVDGQVPLLGVRPDGTRAAIPTVRVREGGYRFMPDGRSLVFLPMTRSLDFWLLDLATGKQRQLTHLGDHGRLQTFDLTRDGRQIVFDRLQENSDIVLIEPN